MSKQAIKKDPSANESQEQSITPIIQQPKEIVKGGYTQEQVELIKNTVAKGATNDELKLFMVVAKKAGLDPFTKQIHFVKRKNWNNKTRNYEEVGTIQTGIDGYRAIAERTNTLAGIDDAVYDTETAKHPNKAAVTVYRIISGIRVPFTASARWEEYVQTYEKNGVTETGNMWKKMPYLMLAKCAEALALRKAFPNDLSGIYTHEEMQQASNVVDAKEVTVGQLEAPEIEEHPEHLEPQQNTGNFTKTTPPSQKQLDLIVKLCDQKGYTKEDIIDMGFAKLTGGKEGTAGELIDALMKAKPKISPANGEPLPIYQEGMTKEEEAIVDSIPF